MYERVLSCFRERELQYVDSVNTTTGREGWLSLNVSESLRHWVNSPEGNRGLYLSVHPADRFGEYLSYVCLVAKVKRANFERSLRGFDDERSYDSYVTADVVRYRGTERTSLYHIL